MTEAGAASFGDQLRRRRELAGFTQEQLAERARLSPNAISALERGERTHPYPQTVRALADALELMPQERAELAASVPRRSLVHPLPAAERTLIAGAGALPVVSSRLIGRTRELEELSAMVRAGARLITLTGPGGVGKTRLAIELTEAAATAFPDGVAFIQLAPLTDASLVIPTIATTLGLREGGGLSLSDALRTHLHDRTLLLLLDNFEQVAEATGEVAALLAAASNLVVLVTSRAPLRLRSEQEYPVSPLALPDLTRVPQVSDVASSPAVNLFVERARAIAPDFALSRTNATAVAAIVCRLDGLPLALELAAARARLLDPTTLLARLDPVLPLLSHGPRDVPERQRTMRSAIQWSYDLLNPPQQALFRRLAVFRDGWTLEAAEVVGSGDGAEHEEVLDLLSELAEQSLIAGGAGETKRFRMLEPIRQYAREKLEEIGEAGGTLRRHTAFFLDLAELAYSELRGPRQADWLERLERENGNLRAAMGWALSMGETETAARMGWALYLFWRLRGHHDEGRRWMEVLLERDLPSALRPRAAMVAAFMTYTQGDYEACEGYSAEALKLARRARDTLCAAYAWCMLGMGALRRRDYQAATSHFEDALPLFRRSGEEVQVPVVHALLGTALLIQGDHDRAAAMFEKGLAMARQSGDRIGICSALYHLAQIALVRGDHRLAARILEEGVAVSRQMRDQANLSYFLEGLAVAAGVQGRAERSAHLFGAAEGQLEGVGVPVYNYYKPDASLYERTLSATGSLLGEAAFEEVRAEGRAMTFEQAAAYALDDDEASSNRQPAA